jgi:hypothetical protein
VTGQRSHDLLGKTGHRDGVEAAIAPVSCHPTTIGPKDGKRFPKKIALDVPHAFGASQRPGHAVYEIQFLEGNQKLFGDVLEPALQLCEVAFRHGVSVIRASLGLFSGRPTGTDYDT